MSAGTDLAEVAYPSDLSLPTSVSYFELAKQVPFGQKLCQAFASLGRAASIASAMIFR